MTLPPIVPRNAQATLLRLAQGFPVLALTGWQLTLGGLCLLPLAWLVYAALGELIPSHIHALSLRAYAPDEL